MPCHGKQARPGSDCAPAVLRLQQPSLSPTPTLRSRAEPQRACLRARRVPLSSPVPAPQDTVGVGQETLAAARWRTAALVFATAAVYFTTAKLGLRLAFVAEQVT